MNDTTSTHRLKNNVKFSQGRSQDALLEGAQRPEREFLLLEFSIKLNFFCRGNCKILSEFLMPERKKRSFLSLL